MNCRSYRSLPLRALATAAFGTIALLIGLDGQSASPSPLTLLSKEGRRPLAVSLVGDQEFVALDDLAAVFQLAVQEDTLGAVTVSYKGKTIVLTPDQALASVSGKLVSLPAPPARAGRRWLVPVEFISRALAPIYDTRLDLRKPARLVIVGELRVPRVTVRYEPLAASARLTIDAAPRTNSTVSQENERLVIRFEADALDIALPPVPALPSVANPPNPANLVQAVHLTDPVTLAIDLGPRFASFRASTQPLDTSTRLTIDILAADSTTAASPTPAPSAAPPLPDLSGVGQPASSIRTIAIDPGHGGDDEGSKGRGGTKEKDLTLAVARRLKGAIEARLGIRVLLTRDEDRQVPLDDRAATANNNKADLFISLHANTSLRPRTAGASMFIAAFDKDAEDRAGAALGTERLPTFTGGSRDIELLLWDLAQIRHVDRSAELARILELQLRDRVPLAPHAVERAPMRVLESANMPAVSVEMGFLSSAEQEKQLTGGEFQNVFVQAIVDAVLKFREFLDSGLHSTGTGGEGGAR